MSEQMNASAETVIREELISNERVIEHPTYGRVRLRRPTPRQQSLIAEARGRKYQKDLFDDSVKSQEEITRALEKRGMWTATDTERLEEMGAQISDLMAGLSLTPFESIEDVASKFDESVNSLREYLKGTEAAVEALVRYTDLEGIPDAKDRKAMFDAATDSNIEDMLDTLDFHRVQVNLLMKLQDIRKDHTELSLKHASHFVDSLESRADQAEQLAKLYYCCTNAETGTYLAPTLEKMWDQPPSDIQLLSEEFYFFVNGTPSSHRAFLEKLGFTYRVTGTRNSSESSPGHPTPNSDGEPQENAQLTSSESETSKS